MKISYVTIYDALDIHNWSGLGFTIAKTLEQQDIKVDYIGDLNTMLNTTRMRLKGRLYKIFDLGKFDYAREPSIAKQYAKQIVRFLKADSDIIFSPGTVPISLLETSKPKVFYTDATFAGLIDFYDDFSGLSKETIRHGNYLEQMALETSKLAIYSSDWAAQTAIDNYEVDPGKIKVVPFGANIQCSRDFGAIKQLVSDRSRKECHLLFIGVDWKRKGGDKAVKVARKLNEMGIKTVLHVVGSDRIVFEPMPDFIINHGFISKATKEGREKIDGLFSTCHFLLLPTIADCTPIVYAEANSFGLPAISSNVGGVSTIVKDNINGRIFPSDSNADMYANYISSIYSKENLYQELAYSSFNEYETRLNWSTAGKKIRKLLDEI